MTKLLATRKRRRLFVGIATVLGALLLIGAELVATWQSPQVAYYNQGIELAQNGDADGALQAFEKSIAAYRMEQNRTPFERALLPAPSLEYAALAYKQRAIMYIMKQKPEDAVLAFKECLKLNPGDSYPAGVSRATAERLREQALVCKYDLELLYKKNPQQAQGEGKGKPQDGEGQGKPKPAPGNDPGKLPGKGNRDDI